jgi:hypothetical protein
MLTYYKFALRQPQKSGAGSARVGFMIMQPTVPYIGVQYPGHAYIDHQDPDLLRLPKDREQFSVELEGFSSASPGRAIAGDTPTLLEVMDTFHRHGEVVFVGVHTRPHLSLIAPCALVAFLDEELTRWFEAEKATLVEPL